MIIVPLLIIVHACVTARDMFFSYKIKRIIYATFIRHLIFSWPFLRRSPQPHDLINHRVLLDLLPSRKHHCFFFAQQHRAPHPSDLLAPSSLPFHRLPPNPNHSILELLLHHTSHRALAPTARGAPRHYSTHRPPSLLIWPPP